MTVRVGVAGMSGRLGSLCADRARRVASFAGGWSGGGGDPAAIIAGSDVVIDVSVPDAVPSHARLLGAAGIAWVLGVTGLTPEQQAVVAETARLVPVVQAANFAPGMTVLLALAERLGAALDAADYDAEILDIHHHAKRDAPSGTALALGRAVAMGRGQTFTPPSSPDRSGPRPAETIGFSAQRAGAVVGEHRLTFASETEIITLEHRALDRRVFAEGAVRAALWTAGREPGLYGMRDVLGI